MKPWYYTIGYPVKVFWKEEWKNGIITNGYRHEDGIINTVIESGEKIWFPEARKNEFLKPNLPDDNPWIPVGEQWPAGNQYQKVWITEKCPAGIHTIKGVWCHNQFKNANGMPMKYEAIAWKPYISPEPYKEVSEE